MLFGANNQSILSQAFVVTSFEYERCVMSIGGSAIEKQVCREVQRAQGIISGLEKRIPEKTSVSAQKKQWPHCQCGAHGFTMKAPCFSESHKIGER